jgi:hypothetical protein
LRNLGIEEPHFFQPFRRLRDELFVCRQAVSDSRADFLSYGFRLS